MTFRKEECVY